jgi:hypothetical protein
MIAGFNNTRAHHGTSTWGRAWPLCHSRDDSGTLRGVSHGQTRLPPICRRPRGHSRTPTHFHTPVTQRKQGLTLGDSTSREIKNHEQLEITRITSNLKSRESLAIRHHEYHEQLDITRIMRKSIVTRHYENPMTGAHDNGRARVKASAFRHPRHLQGGASPTTNPSSTPAHGMTINSTWGSIFSPRLWAVSWLIQAGSSPSLAPPSQVKIPEPYNM